MQSKTFYNPRLLILLLFTSIFCTHLSSAQEAPVWLQYVIGEEITDPGFLESQIVLDPYSISTVRITMAPADYTFLINNTSNNEYLKADMTYESPTIPLTSIKEVGIRLRGAVARGSRKKSFKISFRAFGHDDRDFYSLRKLNLNCDFQDIHLMRAKTSTDLFRLMGVPAARVGYAKLYINGEYRGLFANSEDIDKAFLQPRFGDNNGDLYKCDGATFQNGSGGYWLTTNEETSDNSDILEFINVLNNTPAPQFKAKIEQVLDVDEWLMSLACNVLLGAWDDYWNLAKNFYFYHDVLSDQFNHIPHDFDGSLGTDWYHGNIAYGNVYNWSRNSGRPMVEKLLEVKEYRDRYTHYLMLLCLYPFSLEAMEPEIDRTANMIRSTLTTDPYWGWNPADFDKAFDQAISQGNVKYGMKEYIQLRRNSALEQLEKIGPFIKKLSRIPFLPSELDPVTVSFLVIDREKVGKVTLIIQAKGSTQTIDMVDNGLNGDAEANDFVYSAQIPATDADQVFFAVEATNGAGRTCRYPAENEWDSYAVNYQPPNILINEVLAQNENIIKDNYGEYNDWFELYNPTNAPIDLTGMYVSDNLSNPRKWRLGNLSIPPKGFLLLWADEDAEQGSHHVEFKLAAEGEELGLFDTDEHLNVPIDQLVFDQQTTDVSFGRTQDGAAEWIFYETPTPGRGNRDSTSVPDIGDLMDITDLGGTVSEPHNNSPANETIKNIIDNNIETKYLTFNSSTWVQCNFNEPSLVSGYGIVSANDAPERDPSTWEFQGWDEATSAWITLHSISYEPQWPSRFLLKQFVFANKVAYKNYRLEIFSPQSGNIIQMAELEIYGEISTSTEDITDDMGEVVEPHNDSPEGEGINNIIDNNDQTKYLTFNEHTWVEYRHKEAIIPTGYAIVSANDVPARDPRDWKFQGWGGSETGWVTLHQVENEPEWPQRFFKKKFNVSTDQSFSEFRLYITSGHGVGIIQMAELEIFRTVITSVQQHESPNMVADYSLAQNYPNPFNPTTRICFSLPRDGHATLKIYNTMGQHVRTLVDQSMAAGTHTINWDGTNDVGTTVANSVYFYQLQSDFGVLIQKMMLLR